MATEKWVSYNTADSLIDSTSGATGTTSLYGLTNTSYAYSGVVDNSTLQYPFMDLELALSTTLAALVAPATLNAFVLPDVGSGNYAASSGNPGPAYAVGAAQLVVGATPQYIQIRGILIPPYKYKVVILNNLGVTLPSNTSSTLKGYRYALQVV
jgi:hypothetical protein